MGPTLRQAAVRMAETSALVGWRGDAASPQAILLRYLETLTVIGADKNTTIVFPLPMDVLTPLLAKLNTPS